MPHTHHAALTEWLASKHEVHPSLNALYFSKSGFSKDTWMKMFLESKLEGRMQNSAIDEEVFAEVLDFILSEIES